MCSCEQRPHRLTCPVMVRSIANVASAYRAVVDDQAPAAPSLVAGAINRSVVDAAAAYSARLAQLWADSLAWP